MTSNTAAVWAFRDAALLNLILTGKAGDMITSDGRGCSNCEVVEFKTKGRGEGKQENTHLGLESSLTEDNPVFAKVNCLVQSIFWGVSPATC